MAENKKSKLDKDALDDLLNFDDVVDSATSEEKEADVTETVTEASTDESEAPSEDTAALAARVAELEEAAALRARIAELEAQLAAPVPVSNGRPTPESSLTPEQRRARDEEDRQARQRARALENAPEILEAPNDGDTILIHFVLDGFTAQGRVWYTGQELEFIYGGKAYEQTKNRNGRSWLEDTEQDQYRRFGKIFWRRGPWPGIEYDDDSAAAQERKRNRAAPITSI